MILVPSSIADSYRKIDEARKFITAWRVKTRRAPSRPCKATHEMSTPPPPPSPPLPPLPTPALLVRKPQLLVPRWPSARSLLLLAWRCSKVTTWCPSRPWVFPALSEGPQPRSLATWAMMRYRVPLYHHEGYAYSNINDQCPSTSSCSSCAIDINRWLLVFAVVDIAAASARRRR